MRTLAAPLLVFLLSFQSASAQAKKNSKPMRRPSIQGASLNVEPGVCPFPGVSSIPVPLYPERQNSPNIRYFYQVFGNIHSKSVPIVFLPGGPGGTSIADYSKKGVRDSLLHWGLPADEPWILFDPRTAGCNAGDERVFPDDSLSTWHLAGDVLAVLNHLKVKKYVIFGHSYGSQWATLVAGRASQGEAPRPYFTLLSGILGRGEQDGSFAFSVNLADQWSQLRAQLPAPVVEILDAEEPLGFSPAVWTRFLTRGLITAASFSEDGFHHQLLEKLQSLDSEDPKDHKALLEELKVISEDSDLNAPTEGGGRLYKKIDCHEFSPIDGDAHFLSGQMVSGPEDNVCANESFDHPYDSAAWPISSPIYYIAGEKDPAAPFAGAWYHFENQKSAHRNFIKVHGGGHLVIGDVFPDCQQELWKAMFQLRDLNEALKGCEAPVDLFVQPRPSNLN